jgi:thiamine pyrophosphokinase
MKRILIAIDFSGTLSTLHSSTAFLPSFPREPYFTEYMTNEVFNKLCRTSKESIASVLEKAPDDVRSAVLDQYLDPTKRCGIHSSWEHTLDALRFTTTLVVSTNHSVDVVEPLRDALAQFGIPSVVLRKGRQAFTAPTPGVIYIACSAHAGFVKSEPGYWGFVAECLQPCGAPAEHILVVDDFGAHEFGAAPGDMIASRNAVCRAVQASALNECAQIEMWTFETGTVTPEGQDPFAVAGAEGTQRAIQRAATYLSEYVSHKLRASPVVFDFSKPMGGEHDAVIMLNAPGHGPFEADAWNAGPPRTHRICADGAANFVLSSSHPQARPNVILGDMDSISPEVVSAMDPAVQVVDQTDDQDSTDFEKAIRYAITLSPKKVLILAALGHRLDHELGVFHILLKYCSTLPHVVVMSPTSVVVPLPLGRTEIRGVPKGTKCGIIPMVGPSGGAHSEGLRWNLDGLRMEFGCGIISTSNEVASDTVIVDIIQHPMLWVHYIKNSATDGLEHEKKSP